MQWAYQESSPYNSICLTLQGTAAWYRPVSSLIKLLSAPNWCNLALMQGKPWWMVQPAGINGLKAEDFGVTGENDLWSRPLKHRVSRVFAVMAGIWFHSFDGSSLATCLILANLKMPTLQSIAMIQEQIRMHNSNDNCWDTVQYLGKVLLRRV